MYIDYINTQRHRHTQIHIINILTALWHRFECKHVCDTDRVKCLVQKVKFPLISLLLKHMFRWHSYGLDLKWIVLFCGPCQLKCPASLKTNRDVPYTKKHMKFMSIFPSFYFFFYHKIICNKNCCIKLEKKCKIFTLALRLLDPAICKTQHVIWRYFICSSKDTFMEENLDSLKRYSLCPKALRVFIENYTIIGRLKNRRPMGPLIRDIALREIKKMLHFKPLHLSSYYPWPEPAKKDTIMNKPTCMHPGVRIQMNSRKKKKQFFCLKRIQNFLPKKSIRATQCEIKSTGNIEKLWGWCVSDIFVRGCVCPPNQSFTAEWADLRGQERASPFGLIQQVYRTQLRPSWWQRSSRLPKGLVFLSRNLLSGVVGVNWYSLWTAHQKLPRR